MSVQSKSTKSIYGGTAAAGGVKTFNKFSKIDPGMFDEIADPEERERAFFETIERMKKSIEDLHLREAMNAKQILKLKGDNANLREKLDALDIELKSTEKAKELDTNYLLQQEETLARSKCRPKDEAEDPRIKKELRRMEENNRKLKVELAENMGRFFREEADALVGLKSEIVAAISYFFLFW